MTILVAQEEDQPVQIPEWVRNLSSFRRWAKSEDFPNRGRYAFLDGRLWIDPSMEREGHNQAKKEICRALDTLVINSGAGRFYSDTMVLTNVHADFCTEPDGTFLSHASLQDRRVRLARWENALEAVGSPDMVLEVVGPTSVQKDTDLLRDLYWQAGAREYWLVDPRRNSLVFDILRRGPRGYAAARKLRGWIKSPVFGRSFRLSQKRDRLGLSRYTLRVR